MEIKVSSIKSHSSSESTQVLFSITESRYLDLWRGGYENLVATMFYLDNNPSHPDIRSETKISIASLGNVTEEMYFNWEEEFILHKAVLQWQSNWEGYASTQSFPFTVTLDDSGW